MRGESPGFDSRPVPFQGPTVQKAGAVLSGIAPLLFLLDIPKDSGDNFAMLPTPDLPGHPHSGDPRDFPPEPQFLRDPYKALADFRRCRVIREARRRRAKNPLPRKHSGVNLESSRIPAPTQTEPEGPQRPDELGSSEGSGGRAILGV